MTQEAYQKEQEAGSKIKNVVMSCRTLKQLKTAENMVELFYQKFGKRGLFDFLIACKRFKIVNI